MHLQDGTCISGHISCWTNREQRLECLALDVAGRFQLHAVRIWLYRRGVLGAPAQHRHCAGHWKHGRALQHVASTRATGGATDGGVHGGQHSTRIATLGTAPPTTSRATPAPPTARGRTTTSTHNRRAREATHVCCR